MSKKQPEWIKAKLVKQTVCKWCNYNAVFSDIGQEYEVDYNSKQRGIWICGNCFKETFVEFITVRGGLTNTIGIMPVELFEVYLQ